MNKRGRPGPGFFTRRTAEDWLRSILMELDALALAGAELDVTFATAAREWLRYVEEDRAVKPTTLRNYRCSVETKLIPCFGDRLLRDITAADLERFRASLSVSPRTKNKAPRRALRDLPPRAEGLLPADEPRRQVERLRERRSPDIDVFSPEEVWALVRAAATEQDATIYLTAAFTGLRRGELIALRWRDLDFTNAAVRVRASYALGQLTSPKSGKVRAVPLARDIAAALARLADRGYMTADDDLVFVGATSTARPSGAATSPRCSARACGSCATSGTPSARA